MVKINDEEYLELGGIPYRTDVYKHNLVTGGAPVKIAADLPSGVHGFYCGTVKDNDANVIDVVISAGDCQFAKSYLAIQ